MPIFTDPWDWNRKRLHTHHKHGPEWVKWDGGKCPIEDDLVVHVKHRDGTTTKGIAGQLIWGHYLSDWDILEYMVPV